jgi:hypothetical protein
MLPSESDEPEASNVTVSGVVGLLGEYVNDAVGGVFGDSTDTVLVVVFVAPSSSVTVRVTV